jgi:hypothetical protein
MSILAKVKRRLHMLFLSHHNRCIIETTDMATGRPNKGGIQLTAFKHVCILCGQEFECITQSGIEQIASGVPYNEAIQWMNERRQNDGR